MSKQVVGANDLSTLPPRVKGRILVGSKNVFILGTDDASGIVSKINSAPAPGAVVTASLNGDNHLVLDCSDADFTCYGLPVLMSQLGLQQDNYGLPAAFLAQYPLTSTFWTTP